jgi:hypothetical protein
LKPRDFNIAQPDAWPEITANHPVHAQINIIIGFHMRIASRIVAVACDILLIQVEQVGTREGFVIVASVVDFDALIADKDCCIVVWFENIVVNRME